MKLAAEGYYIVVNFRSNQEEAEKTLAAIRALGSDGELLKFDVGDKNDINQVLGSWIDTNKEKPIEILVNNAGIRKDNLLMTMSDEDWSSVLSTNLDSFFYVTKLVVPVMLFHKYGRIVNVVSLSGVKGLPGQTNYSASKAGVIGASKALAQEIGRRGSSCTPH